MKKRISESVKPNFATLISGLTKEAGIILFPVIGLILYRYEQLSKINFSGLIITTFISVYYIFFTFLDNSKFHFFSFKDITDLSLANSTHFSIVTPLNYGLDAIYIWAGSISQEICQILYTGILFVVILAFFHQKSHKILYYSVIFLEILLLCCIAFFPTTQIFSFSVIPYGNFKIYLFLFLILILIISSLYILKKVKVKFDNYSFFLLSWVGIFLLFFMINTMIYGYGIKNLIDVSILDFRYLIPAFPPLIILFSKGLSNMLALNDKKIKSLSLLVISLLIIINIIISLNLAFIFANYGNAHLEGYTYAQNATQSGIIYSHWPFYYLPEGKSYDIGKYSWVTNNCTYKSISNQFISGSTILGNSHFFEPKKYPNINFTTISSKSLYLDPMLPKVSKKTLGSVFVGIVP